MNESNIKTWKNKRDHIIFFLLEECGLFISYRIKKNKFTLANIQPTEKNISEKNTKYTEIRITEVENILNYIQKNCSNDEYLKAEKFIYEKI